MSRSMSLATAGSSLMGRRDEINPATEGHTKEEEWSAPQWNAQKRPTSSSRRPTNGSYILSSSHVQQTPPRSSMNSLQSSSSAFTPVHMMHSPSISSNAEGFFGRESRTDSIGTLWSSADVPLVFDDHRGSGGDKNSWMGFTAGSISMQPSSSSRSGTNMSIPRGISFTTSSSNQTLQAFQRPSEITSLPTVSDIAGNENQYSSEPHELLLSDDGQEFIAVPPLNKGSRGSRPSTAKTVTNANESPSSSLPNGWTVSNEDPVESKVALLQHPGSRPSSSAGPSQKKRPAPLHLAEASFVKSSGSSTDRSRVATDVPLSVSHGSLLTVKSQKSKMKGGNEQQQSRKPPSTSPATALPRRSPKTNSADLYKHAERFFDSSYSMAPSLSPTVKANLALSSPDMARLSRFSDDSHITYEEQTNSIGPTDHTGRQGLSSARSQNSHSSAESSNTPEIVEQFANAATLQILRSGITQEAQNATLTYTNGQRTKYGSDEEQPMTPLRVAMSLANPASPRLTEHQQNLASMQQSLNPSIHSARRPSTTDSAIPTTPKSPHRPNVRHTHTSSDHEVLRRLREEAAKEEVIPPLPASTVQKVDDKLAFLHAPATQPVPLSPKRGALFGLRTRAVSTPKLRQSRGGSQDGSGLGVNSNLQPDNHSRPTSSSRPQHPPQAPSGRFRSTTINSDTERCDSISSVNSVIQNGQRLSVTGSDEASLHTSGQQPKSRRPSTSEALAAAARRLRRPSRNGSNSSLTTPLNAHGSQSVADLSRQRVGSSASSQIQTDLRHISSNASLRPSSRKAKSGGTPTNATRPPPKTKGGWASHLAQGLTLHIEQGNKKIAMRMNYQYYDPFGRPESLCTSNNVEEHHSQRRSSNGRIRNSFSTGAGQSSRNGSISVSNEENSDESTMGVLEFTPDVPSPGREGSQGSHNHLAFLSSDSRDAVILKHLTIGEDTKADLITRQADLSLRRNGVHEVSGSERKGKVSWRFEFSIEDVKRKGSGPIDNATTPKMGSKPFHETIDGIKMLRPIKFSCSTTLLDPSRARKSRVINMIRKQIGSHIESHSFASNIENVESDSSAMYQSGTPLTMNQSIGSMSPPQTSPLASSRRLEAPLSPRSLPRSRQGSTPYARRAELPTDFTTASPSPARNVFNAHVEQHSPTQIRSPLHPPSSIGSSAGELGSSLGTEDYHLAALRNASVISTTSSGAGSATWSPASRLVPFKARRAIVDPSKQMQGRPSISEQQANTNGLAANAVNGIQQRSPLVIGSSLESPLSTSIEASPSPGKYHRELGSNSKMQPIKTSHQEHFPRKYAPPSTALGLETHPTSNHNESKEDFWYEDSTARQWASSKSRTQSRRLRAVTSEGIHEAQTLDVRPPTASEEIKMAYLNNSSRLHTADSTASSKPRSRHGGNGSGHGHSHSVYQTPPQLVTMDSPPRRMTSASIHQHNDQNNQQTQHEIPSSPLRKKDLPPTPSKKAPIAITSKAARAISGSSLKQGATVGSNGKFDPPEGPFWI